MAIEAMAWNVRDAFSDPNRIPVVLEAVKDRKPDVVFFSEAYSETDGMNDAALEDLERQGYDTLHGLYEDNDGRKDRHGLLAIGRRDILRSSKIISMATRNAAELTLINPSTDVHVAFYGAHLDDRYENRRLNQAQELLRGTWQSIPSVIFGDLNAMHGSDMKSQALRSLRGPVSLLPRQDFAPGVKQSKISRIGSLAARLTEMADGGTMEEFEAAGYADVDAMHRPTKGFAQLDHILISKGLLSKNFKRHKSVDGFDHRAISARIGR